MVCARVGVGAEPLPSQFLPSEVLAGLGGVPLNQKIGVPKDTAVRQNACGMNMPMGDGRGGGNSRSFPFRSRMGVGGDALALCWWREEEGIRECGL